MRLLDLPGVTKAGKIVGPYLGSVLGNTVAVLQPVAVDTVVVPAKVRKSKTWHECSESEMRKKTEARHHVVGVACSPNYHEGEQIFPRTARGYLCQAPVTV